MISYNSQSTVGDYKIQIETDQRDYYDLVQKIVQLMIDKELYQRLYYESEVQSTPLQKNLGDYTTREFFPK